MDDLSQYWNMNYYDDNKKLNFKIFELEFSHIFNDVDDNLFKEIFEHTSVKLAPYLTILSNCYNKNNIQQK